MKIKNHRDFWAGLLFVAAGLLFAILASNHNLGDNRQPGPGFFPLLLGLMTVGLGCLLIFKALTFETDDGGPIGKVAWRGLLLVAGSVVLAGLILPRLGMFVTIPLLIYPLGLAAGRFSLPRWFVTSLVSTGSCWLIFVHLLGLPIALMPAGSY